MSEDPSRPPEPHARLSFRCRPSDPADQGLERVRTEDPRATLSHAVFRGGVLRFRVRTGDYQIPDVLRTPATTTWRHAGSTRFSERFSVAEERVLRGFLEQGISPVEAVAELVLEGVGARAPVRVDFDAASLLRAIGDRLGGEMARTELHRLLSTEADSVPVTWQERDGGGARQDTSGASQALTDRLVAEFGNWTPAPADDLRPHLTLPEPSEVGDERYEWDLDVPRAAERLFLLRFDPFGEVQEALDVHGMDAFVRNVTVPPLRTGAVVVDVSANLPLERSGIPAIGVHLEVPPRPPDRVQVQSRSLEFKPPEDRGSAGFEFSPEERPAGRYRTFLLADTGDGVERIEGEPASFEGDRLFLTVDDYPVRFVPVAATPSLLEQARIRALARWSPPGGETAVRHERELTRKEPAGVFTPPEGAEGELLFQARERENEEASPVRQSSVLPLTGGKVSLTSFREYGPHSIAIRATFGDTDTEMVAVELRAAAGEDGTASVIHLTPEEPEKRWRWFARSIFRPGYQYRRYDPGGDPEWSAIRPPDESLTLTPASPEMP